MKMRYVFKTTLWFLFGILPSSAFSFSGLTYHGRIIKPDGTALDSSTSTVDFKIQIRSPGTNNCLMYEETQNAVTVTNGVFALIFGSDSSVGTFYGGTTSIKSVLDNSSSFTFGAPSGCTVTTTYNPNSGDGRNLAVFFRENAGAWEPMPVASVTAVPYAVNAMQADKVGLHNTSSLLRVENTGVPASAAAFTSAQFTELQNLIAGTSSQYTQQNINAGTEVSVISGGASAPVTGSLWLDSSSGTLKFYDGSSIKTIGAGASATGTVTAITAGTGLSGGTITTSGTISIAPGGVSSTELANNSVTSSKIVDGTIVSADLSPSISISTTGSITASGAITSASNITATGNVIAGGLSTGGSLSVAGNSTILGNEAVTGNVGANSISTRAIYLSNATGSTLSLSVPTAAFTNFGLILPSQDGTNGQVLSTNGSGVLSWATASGGGLSASTAYVNGGNAFGGNATIGLKDNFKLGFLTNNTTQMTIDSNGNVGIGNASPSAVLHLKAGTAAAGTAPLKLTAGTNLGVTESGAVEYNGSDLYITTNAGRYSLARIDSNGNGNWSAGGGASGGDAFSFGVFSYASGIYSFATGNGTTAIGPRSATFGSGTAASGDSSLAAGNGTIANSYSEMAAGTFNKTFGGETAGSWVSTDPLFVIGNGASSGARSNSFVMLKNGKTSIGNGASTPGGVLDINGDLRFKGSTSGYNGFQAAAVAGSTVWTLPSVDGTNGQVLSTNGSGILSWATSSGGGLSASTAYVNGGNSFGSDATIGLKDSFNLNFLTNNQTRMTIDSSGNVGIGTSVPTNMLEIAGNLSAPSADISAISADIVSSGSFAANINNSQGLSSAYSQISSNLTYTGTASSPSALYGSDILVYNGAFGGTVGTEAGVHSLVWTPGFSTNTNSYGVFSEIRNIGATDTNAFGGYFQVINSAGTLSKGYGLFVGPVGGTSKWSLYVQDTAANNFFGGKVGIGVSSPTASLDVSGTVKLGSTLSFSGSSSGSLAFKAPASAGNVLWTLPSQDGSNGQVLSTNGSGTLSWATSSGGGLSASTAYVNGGNAFAGDATIGLQDAYKLNFLTNNQTRMTIDSSGKVGIGTSAPSALLEVGGALSATTGTIYTLTSNTVNTKAENITSTVTGNSYIGLNISPTIIGSSLSGSVYGSYTNLAFAGTGASPATIYGSDILTYNNAFGTVGVTTGQRVRTWTPGGSTNTAVYGIDSEIYNIGSTNTNSYAGFFTNQNLSVSTNAYGVFIGPVQGTNAWSLYAQDTNAPSFFAGKVGIGVSSPTVALDVAGSAKVSGTLSLAGASSGSLAFKAPASSGNVLWTLPSQDGSNGQVLSTNGSGTLSWASSSGGGLSASSAYVNGGNAFAGDATIGLNDNYKLSFKTNNTMQMTIDGSGNVGIGTSVPAGTLDVRGGTAAAATDGSNIYIIAQNAGSGNQNGGSVNIYAGSATGTGSAGVIDLSSPTVASPYISSLSGAVAISVNPQLVSSGTGVGDYIGVSVLGSLSPFLDSSSADTYGTKSIGQIFGSHNGGKITGLYAQGQAWVTAVKTTSSVIGVQGDANQNGKGTVTNAYGAMFDVSNTSAVGGTISNGYGVLVGNIAATSKKYSIYAQDSTAPSFFAGNIGIGTSSPTASLDVAGAIKVGSTLSFAGATSGAVGFQAPAVSGNALWTLPSTDGTSGQVLATSGAGILSWTSVGSSLSGSTTLFGDGTSSAPSISFANDTDTGFYRPGTNILGFSTAGSERVRIDSSGNVGIGTSSPTARLTISGDVTYAIPADNSGQNIIFTNGNVQTSSYSTTNTIKLCGLKDGGQYTALLTGYAAGTTVTVQAYSDTACSSSINFDFGGSTSGYTTTFVTGNNATMLSVIYFASRGVAYGSIVTNFYH